MSKKMSERDWNINVPFSQVKHEKMISYLENKYNDKNIKENESPNQESTVEQDFVDNFCVFCLLNADCYKINIINNEKLWGLYCGKFDNHIRFDCCLEQPLEILKQELSSLENEKRQIEKVWLGNKNLNESKNKKLTDAEKIDNCLLEYLGDAYTENEKRIECVKLAISNEEQRLKPK